MPEIKPATKTEVAWLCTQILMRLGKNDFAGVDHYITRLRTKFDEWMRLRPEKARLALRGAQAEGGQPGDGQDQTD